jgi:hypothetical protein
MPCTALQVFDHDQWASHRSTSRYFRHAKGLFTSRIVRGLWSPLVYVGAISLAVCSYEQLVLLGAIHTPSIALPVTGPFSLSTFGTQLLLERLACSMTAITAVTVSS